MLGVYGGTFNPVHYGHLRTAFEVFEFFALDQLRLIPCRIPAHRQQPAVSAEIRFQLLQLAIAGMPGWIADRRELERPGPSYMVDTLASLRQEFSKESILLFMGQDAFNGLEKWHCWQQLFDYAHIVVMTRPGYQKQISSDWLQNKLTQKPAALQHKIAGLLYFHAVTPLDISSSDIRALIKAGRQPKFLMPDNVIQAINQQQLYQTGN
jgi:nicotinate-nucleotide adenylyltransferase